jgi:hypothetical protein
VEEKIGGGQKGAGIARIAPRLQHLAYLQGRTGRKDGSEGRKEVKK